MKITGCYRGDAFEWIRLGLAGLIELENPESKGNQP
jgi:hypothetical protein